MVRGKNRWGGIGTGIMTATLTETHETSQPDKLALFLLGKTDKDRG